MSLVLMGTVFTAGAVCLKLSTQRCEIERNIESFCEGLFDEYRAILKRKRVPESVVNIPPHAKVVGIEKDDHIQLGDWIIKGSSKYAVQVDNNILEHVQFLSVQGHMRHTSSPIVGVIREVKR